MRTPPNTTSPLYVGGIGGRDGSYFNGCIDELRISNLLNPMVVDDIGEGMGFLFDAMRYNVMGEKCEGAGESRVFWLSGRPAFSYNNGGKDALGDH